MGRYGEYAPHTVEYQIYRGEAIDSCARRAMTMHIAHCNYPCMRKSPNVQSFGIKIDRIDRDLLWVKWLIGSSRSIFMHAIREFKKNIF